MTEIKTDRQHYPALDGVRGIAILLVVFFHNFGFINYFFFGWLGVDLFFVLSGFLITDILIRETGSKNYLKSFYTRRVLRIFPIYYLLLIIFLLILPHFISSTVNLEYYTSNQAWLWTYTQNWLYIIKPHAYSNILLHLWSLAVEEQYYLIWPFVILIFRKPKVLLAISLFFLIGIIILRLVLWNKQIEGFQYFSWFTFSRIDGICIGSALALIKFILPKFITNNTPYIISSVAIFNFVFYFINKNYGFSFPYFPLIGYTTFAIVFAVIVSEAATLNKNFITIPLSFAPLRFIGKISYGFYIYHWPIYVLLFPILLNYLKQSLHINTGSSQFLAAAIATIAGFLISLLSFYFFEMPFLKLKKYFR
jgi:peptidoglycan/LPS O-acetylase OafA/YrhL